MFQQLLTPVGDSLGLSFFVANRCRAGASGSVAQAGLAGRIGRAGCRPRHRRYGLEDAGQPSDWLDR